MYIVIYNFGSVVQLQQIYIIILNVYVSFLINKIIVLQNANKNDTKNTNNLSISNYYPVYSAAFFFKTVEFFRKKSVRFRFISR